MGRDQGIRCRWRFFGQILLISFRDAGPISCFPVQTTAASQPGGGEQSTAVEAVIPSLASYHLACFLGACPLIRIMPTVSTIYGTVSRNCGIYCSFARAHGDLWTSS